METTPLTPEDILDPQRVNNESKRTLNNNITKFYDLTTGIKASLLSIKSLSLKNTVGRISIELSLGKGKLAERKLKNLLDLRSRDELRHALTQARKWRVLITPDRTEFRKTPGHGYCGFVSMDRIINEWERTICPSPQEGINAFLNAIETLSSNSLEPTRTPSHSTFTPPKSAWHRQST